MPLSAIHLRHMTRLAELSVCLLPASPSFYTQPKTIEEMIDTVVQRILKQLQLDIPLVRKWGNPVTE